MGLKKGTIMIIEERLSGLTSDDITNLQTELEKELNELEDRNDLIDNEISNLGRQILKIREQIKELEITSRQGHKLVREKKLDIKITNRAFWRSK